MLEQDFYLQSYRTLFLIRKVEERIANIYSTDKVKSPIHLSIGQEAPSVGVCAALNPGDITFGTYRGHALYLAKKGNLRQMIAELYGKKTGCGAGKSGSMHLGDKTVGMMGTSAIVSSSIPNAVGYAFAQSYKKTKNIVVVFFGDGATEEGVFYESLNFAALKKLPILFVCENNLYAINTPLEKRVPKANYCEKAEALGVSAYKVLNNNIEDIFLRTQGLVQSIRGGGGPSFVEIETYRWREHVGPAEDWHLGYRTKEEGDQWIKADEMVRIGNFLESNIRQKLEAEVLKEIEDAFDFAENSPFPSSEDLYSHIYQ